MLGDKIKTYRKLNNLTQIEFSKKVRMSRSYIADLEAGRNPGNLKLLNKIIKGTHTEMSDWVDDFGKYKKINLNLTEGYIMDLVSKNNLNLKNYKIPENEQINLIKTLQEDLILYLLEKNKQE